MDTRVLDILNAKLEERKEATLHAIGTGSAKDYAEYANLCGLIRGLGAAQMEITDLLRKLKEIDDED